MTLVVDASVVVAALIGTGVEGSWADQLLVSDDLAAPHLMPVEVANVFGRGVLSGAVALDQASLAHANLLQIRVALFPYEPVAERVWELRESVTAYDAWYIALAESLDAPIATLDRRLVAAPGPRCAFVTPPA